MLKYFSNNGLTDFWIPAEIKNLASTQMYGKQQRDGKLRLQNSSLYSVKLKRHEAESSTNLPCDT